VVERATTRPARVLGRHDLGTLRPGAHADVALFKLDDGDFAFYDVRGIRRDGHSRLRNTRTLVGGRVLPSLPPTPPALWMTPSYLQTRIAQAGHVPDGYVWPYGNLD
jgi:dihydroorotase